jgi:hypothetical protein
MPAIFFYVGQLGMTVNARHPEWTSLRLGTIEVGLLQVRDSDPWGHFLLIEDPDGNVIRILKNTYAEHLAQGR